METCMPKWTREKVSALNTSDLPKLRANAARWLVIAPLSLLPEGTVITEQIPELKNIKGAFEGETGLVTNDFDQAAGSFANLFAEIYSI
jgi:hypothetical protein